MSYKSENILSLVGQHFDGQSYGELQKSFQKALVGGMHGIGFSPYQEGQEPGDQLSEQQIRDRMEIIRPYVKWIRSFSCTEGNELIPKIAHEMGIKTLVGAWLGEDEEKNAVEINNLIELAEQGHVDIAAVGNEVLYREDLSEERLLAYIYQVKERLTDVPVGYVDAYYEFENCPRITEACDVILANCYPFWEGCHLDYSLMYMQNMYEKVLRVAGDKKVIISETGWPSEGQSVHGAQPSFEGAMKYFINTQEWSKSDNIDIFYFSSFDESWKTGAEGDVGAYWGLWDKEERLKF